jgi:hypothetical protein
MTEQELDALRLAFNEAHREFRREPTEETKASYKAAMLSYRNACNHVVAGHG